MEQTYRSSLQMKRLKNRHQYVKMGICVLVFVLGIILFTLNQEQVDPDPTTGGGDPQTYYLLATRLLDQQTYAESWPDPPFRAWRPPLYPTFLTILLWLGDGNQQFIIFVQYGLVLLSGGLIWYLYFLVSGSYYGGLVSCVLIYLYSPFYFYASFFYSETLFIFLLLFLLITAYKAFDSKKTVWFVLTGILIVASILTRTVTLPIFILSTISLLLVLIFNFVQSHKNLPIKLPTILHRRLSSTTRQVEKTITTRNILAFIGISWLLLGTWSLRNYLVLNQFVLVNTANGLNLYFGTRHDFYLAQTSWNDEVWRVSPERWSVEHSEVVTPLRTTYGEVGANKAISDIAVSYIIQNPTDYLTLKLQILYRYLVPNLSSPVHLGPRFVSFENIEVIFHGLFLLGLLSTMFTRNIRWLALLCFFFLLVLSSSLAFFSERFLIVTTPLYFLFAVKGLFEIVNWLIQSFWNQMPEVL